MIGFLGSLPTGVWFLIILSLLWGLSAFAYLLGAEVGQERGFKLGYSRGKLVGTQETNYFYSVGAGYRYNPQTDEYRRDGEVNA